MQNRFFLILFLSYFSLAMEAPLEQMQKIINRDRVQPLTALAAQKCVHLFDPKVNYKNARKNLKFGHAVSEHISQALASHAADRLETILDNELPISIKTNYTTPSRNLYENNHGIQSKDFFYPAFNAHCPAISYFHVCLSQDKKICARRPNNSNELTITIWDVETGNKKNEVTLFPDPENECFNISPIVILDNNRKILATYARELPDMDGKPACASHYCLFDIQTGEKLYDYPGDIACQKDGEFMIVEKIKKLEIREIKSNKLLNTIMSNALHGVWFRPKISPLADYIAITHGKSVSIWDPRSCISEIGTRLNQFKTTSVIKNICFSADGCSIAIADEKKITIWNPYEDQIVATLENLNAEICVGYFLDGNKKLVTYCPQEGFFQVWDIVKKECLTQKHLIFPILETRCSKKFHLNIVSSISSVDNDSFYKATNGGDDLLFKTYNALAKELRLQELTALLILDYEATHKKRLNAQALAIIKESQHPTIKRWVENNFFQKDKALEKVYVKQPIKRKKSHNKKCTIS